MSERACIYPLPETTTYKQAQAVGETRSWRELSEVEQIGFEVANILESPSWVNNFPLYLVGGYRIRPLAPEVSDSSAWKETKKLFDDVDGCVEKLGFPADEINGYMFEIGGDTTYNELMRKFGAAVYREMRLLGYGREDLRG